MIVDVYEAKVEVWLRLIRVIRAGVGGVFNRYLAVSRNHLTGSLSVCLSMSLYCNSAQHRRPYYTNVQPSSLPLAPRCHQAIQLAHYCSKSPS